jgi:hypothetical protein
MTPTADTASIGQGNSESSSTMRNASGSKADTPDRQRNETVRSTSGRSSTAELGGMILAFIFGGLGFAVRILWVPALLAMAVVFGLILADRRASRGSNSKGVVPEIVANVVNEARDIYQAASSTSEREDDNNGAKEISEGDPEPSDKVDAPRTRNERGDPDGTSTPGGLDVTSVDNLRANGHAAIHDDRPLVTDERAPLDPMATTDGSKDTGIEIGTKMVDATSGGVTSVMTESTPTEAPSAATQPEENESKSGGSEVPPASINGITGMSASPFPVRLIISVDHMASRNSLLRPVRTRLLNAATSLSKAIVQMASDPLDDSSR